MRSAPSRLEAGISVSAIAVDIGWRPRITVSVAKDQVSEVTLTVFTPCLPTTSL